MPEAPALLVAGSIALDTVEGRSHRIEDELGGSALYFAMAASLIMPVTLVAPVGAADVEQVRSLVRARPIDMTGMQVFDAPTYRWQAHEHEGRNIDLGSRDSIYDLWSPKLPSGYSGWAFVGSVRPDRQLELIQGLSGARLLAADSMLSYIQSRPGEASEVLRLARWYFCNQDELQALGGGDPEEFRKRWSLEGLVVKLGPGGATTYTEGGILHVPALLHRPVVDTTGAGDALAAGMLARWISTGGDHDGWAEALPWGVACASLTIEGIGLRAIAQASTETLAARVAEVRETTRREL
ncbi:MAG: PfkB family carbohydrate kinase [Candidatus Dormibacterales bacterium]